MMRCSAEVTARPVMPHSFSSASITLGFVRSLIRMGLRRNGSHAISPMRLLAVAGVAPLPRQLRGARPMCRVGSADASGNCPTLPFPRPRTHCRSQAPDGRRRRGPGCRQTTRLGHVWPWSAKPAMILHRMWDDGADFRRIETVAAYERRFSFRPGMAEARSFPRGRWARQPVKVQSLGRLRTNGRETGRGVSPPSPIMRRPGVDREEKRVIHGTSIRHEEQLASTSANQESMTEALIIKLLP